MELTRNIVVVGASAGGVEALSTLLGALPADLPAAVFVVLHIPSHTVSELHLVLDRVCALRVVSARDGQGIEAGTVYVAPADRYLMLKGDVVRLTRGPKECRVRPAIDVLSTRWQSWREVQVPLRRPIDSRRRPTRPRSACNRFASWCSIQSFSGMARKTEAAFP
jgi:hypothetical protein